MKRQKTNALLALLTVCYLHSTAQTTVPPLNQPDYNKPKIFTDLPDKLDLRVTDMEALLNLPVGTQVNATVATGFSLSGTVVSKSNPAEQSVKTVVIKSALRKNALLTFSRVKKDDGSFFYVGRMISRDAGDAFEIAKEGNTYVLRKKSYYDLLNE